MAFVWHGKKYNLNKNPGKFVDANVGKCYT
jgi:hypothetical protein